MSTGGPITALAANLAANLHYVRERRGLTQSQLARLCGVPRSTIGQIESGAGNPTLSVLARVALALHLTIEELLSAPRAQCQLFKKGALRSETRGPGGTALVQKLLPDPIPGMEIDRIEIVTGGRMSGIPHRPGTREYLACESGQIALFAAGERYDLAPGDVVAFQGDQPHSYQNSGRSTAVGYSVVTLAPLMGGRGAIA
jgi:transcriptional regulator with XRE-family HTH domain